MHIKTFFIKFKKNDLTRFYKCLKFELSWFLVFIPGIFYPGFYRKFYIKTNIIAFK